MRAEQSKSLYSAEIIQDAEAISPDQFKDIVRSADKSSKSEIEDLPEEEIDDFLKNYGKPQHHCRFSDRRAEYRRPEGSDG